MYNVILEFMNVENREYCALRSFMISTPSNTVTVVMCRMWECKMVLNWI
jgi:hypothetical protein